MKRLVGMVVAVVILTAILPSLALSQEFYGAAPVGYAQRMQPVVSRFAGLPVHVRAIPVAGQNVAYWGNFEGVARELLSNYGFRVLDPRVPCGNQVLVEVAQFLPTRISMGSYLAKRLGLASSGFQITTSGTIEVWIGGELAPGGSVSFRGSDVARGTAMSYNNQPQAASGIGYNSGTAGGVAYSATPGAGYYTSGGQWVQPGGGGYVQPGGYAQPQYGGGANVSLDAFGQAGYYIPSGGQQYAGGYSAPYSNGSYPINPLPIAAPGGNGAVVSDQQFPDSENAIRKALEPAIRKLALGR